MKLELCWDAFHTFDLRFGSFKSLSDESTIAVLDDRVETDGR